MWENLNTQTYQPFAVPMHCSILTTHIAWLGACSKCLISLPNLATCSMVDVLLHPSTGVDNFFDVGGLMSLHASEQIYL